MTFSNMCTIHSGDILRSLTSYSISCYTDLYNLVDVCSVGDVVLSPWSCAVDGKVTLSEDMFLNSLVLVS